MRYAAWWTWGCLLVGVASAGHGQARWVVEPTTSLAWWQMVPHLNHLWATTCPGEPSWRPGEGRSGGWSINPALKLPRTGYANDIDTVHMPLYPRPAGAVHPICVEAVHGEVSTPDTVGWRGVRGQIAVLGEALVTGEAMRDVLMHRFMQTWQFPQVQFTLDSVTNLTKQADTLFGSAVGTLTVRQQRTPTTALVKAFPDAGGMRVLAKFHVPAQLLTQWTPSIHYLGLGVRTGIWHDFYMGVDMVLKPVDRAAIKGGSN